MRKEAQIIALHSALWGADRWYRWSWYVGPAAMALLIIGWICIGKPAGTATAAAWGKPITPAGQTATAKPQPTWIQTQLSRCFSKTLGTEQSIQSCTWLINTPQVKSPQLATVLTQRGFLQREKDQDRALADYDSALNAQPDFVDALSGRAWINMARSNYDAALQDLNKAIELAPKSGTARYYRGFAYLRLKDYPKALVDLNEAQSAQPDNAEVYLARGEVEQGQGSYDAALFDYESFNKRASKDPRGLIASGAVLEAMGRPKDALEALENAVKMAPDNDYAVGERDRLREKIELQASNSASKKGDQPK